MEREYNTSKGKIRRQIMTYILYDVTNYFKLKITPKQTTKGGVKMNLFGVVSKLDMNRPIGLN